MMEAIKKNGAMDLIIKGIIGSAGVVLITIMGFTLSISNGAIKSSEEAKVLTIKNNNELATHIAAQKEYEKAVNEKLCDIKNSLDVISKEQINQRVMLEALSTKIEQK